MTTTRETPVRRLGTTPLAVVGAAVPALLVALVGLAHPVFLTPESAERWRAAHLALLPLFPLVGGAVWWVLRGEGSPLAWTARVLAAGYAVGYTALDSIAGVGAAHQLLLSLGRGDPRPPVEDLFAAGDPLGRAGVVLLAVAGGLAALVLARHARVRREAVLAGGGAVLLVAGCWLHLRHHVFPPSGVLGMLLVAAGTAGLEAARGLRRT